MLKDYNFVTNESGSAKFLFNGLPSTANKARSSGFGSSK